MNTFKKLADELHKPIIRKFTRRRVIVNHVDQIWAVDLVDMGKFSRWNKGIKYLLMIIDVFSKFGFIEPLKDKKGETVAKAFEKVFKSSSRRPEKVWSDKGTEFYNKYVKDLFKREGIELYSTENEEKSSVVERWNRTIKSRMWKEFTARNSTQYLGFLPELLKVYNNTKHRSIKMTPVEASKKSNEDIVYFNLHSKDALVGGMPKFKVGDKVRISKYKRMVFDKGFEPNFTEEVFVVDKVQRSNPITYKY